MRRLTSAEVHALKVGELGLDPTAADLTTPEAIAGALRRAAGFLCPCSGATLVRAVVRPLRGLVDDLQSIRDLADEMLEALVALGDLLEHHEFGESEDREKASLLYAAPASFVLRESGTAILLGIATDQLSALPPEMESRIDYVGHVRRLSPLPGEDLGNELSQLGLVELSDSRWLRMPPAETPAELVSRLDRLLESTPPSREIPGLLLLEPSRPVNFYPRRWVEPRSQTGRFVARRTQVYGADLWCYVELGGGLPERMIDLPVAGSRWRGCDEAWQLQMAIDAQRGEPQRFRVRPGPAGTLVLGLFSPVPMWVRRRWDAMGELLQASGCLFAYRFADAELEEELRFARESLWLRELDPSA